MKRKVRLLAVVSWPAKRKMKAFPRMFDVVKGVVVEVLVDASMRGAMESEIVLSVGNPFV